MYLYIFQHLCGTSEALATAYKQALDVVGTNHLDIDVEVKLERIGNACARYAA
jgi:hypothetical protein